MVRQSTTVLVMLALLAAACAGETVTPSTATIVLVDEPSTPTTRTVLETTTTTETGEPVVLAEVVGAPDLSVRTRLEAGVRYRLEMEGATVEISPPFDGWDLLDYQTRNGALFSWRGPSGFRIETLDVRVEVLFDGVGAGWSWVEEIGERGRESVGASWTLVDEGTADVGGRLAEWREYRTPEHSPNVPVVGPTQGEPFSFRFSVGGVGRLLRDTSARFYVVPVGDLAVMVMGFETRCACYPNPRADYDRGSQIADEVENELRDWLPELEAFLAAMEFIES